MPETELNIAQQPPSLALHQELRLSCFVCEFTCAVTFVCNELSHLPSPSPSGRLSTYALKTQFKCSFPYKAFCS